METSSVEIKSRIPKQERVSLDEITASKIDQWLDQVLVQVPGIKIGRSELVRWLVNSHVEVLSKDELQQIRECYFDEMEFALWMVRQLRESRARGEKIALSDLMGDTRVSRLPRKPRKKTAEVASE